VKHQLAAVRMLFAWLITGQILPHNPADAVRGPKHAVKAGKKPVLEGKEWRKLPDAIPSDTVRDLRDRALIAIHLAFRGLLDSYLYTAVDWLAHAIWRLLQQLRFSLPAVGHPVRIYPVADEFVAYSLGHVLR
jgi:hypothetical protein